jgi:hypothetical protein
MRLGSSVPSVRESALRPGRLQRSLTPFAEPDESKVRHVVTVIENMKMKDQNHEPKSEHTHRSKDGGRELEQTLRHALALAVTERVARNALVGAQAHAHRAQRGARMKATGHLVGYGALIGYLAYLTRSPKQPAPLQSPSRASSADTSPATAASVS